MQRELSRLLCISALMLPFAGCAGEPLETSDSNTETVSQALAVPRMGYINYEDPGITGSSSWYLEVKEGSLNAPWAPTFGNVGSVHLSGTRISVIPRANRHCYVKDGELSSAPWVDEWADGNVSQCFIAGNRIGLITLDGTFRVKEGGLSAGWTVVAQNAVGGSLSQNRIAMTQIINGVRHCFVREGALGSDGWVDEYANITQCVISGNRIGVLTTDHHFLVKEGPLNAGWDDEYAGVTSGDLSGNRIGVLTTDRHFLVKEGPLNAGWDDEYSNVTQGILSGSRIGVVTKVNDRYFVEKFLVKEGPLNAGWVEEGATTTPGSVGVLPVY